MSLPDEAQIAFLPATRHTHNMSRKFYSKEIDEQIDGQPIKFL